MLHYTILCYLILYYIAFHEAADCIREEPRSSSLVKWSIWGVNLISTKIGHFTSSLVKWPIFWENLYSLKIGHLLDYCSISPME